MNLFCEVKMAINKKVKKCLAIIIPTVLAVIILLCGLALWLFGQNPSDNNSSEVSSEQASSITASSEIVSSEPEDIKEITLDIVAPDKKTITVYKPDYVVKGSADPNYPLTINNTPVSVDETGLFAHNVKLNVGKNTIEIVHKDTTEVYTVNYQKIVIKSISPSSSTTVESNETLVVSCVALKGSKVTATFDGKKITLYTVKGDADASDSDYEEYAGSFETPVNQGETKSYGKVAFKAVSDFATSTKYSGNINVKKFDPAKFDGGNGYPENSEYLNVGENYVIEVVNYQAETFNSKDATDLSRPTNNYLPKGTVDYCSPYPKTFTLSGKKTKMYTARYGKQLYSTSPRGTVNTKIYEGTLPETNSVSLALTKTVGHHTVMTFNVDWKAPFKFEMEPQKYKSESNRDYIIEEPTFSYIDITFCYADSLEGLPDLSNNPVFSSAEIIQGDYDRVLRLHLREKGVFYGWSSEYNSQGQLEFWFLNPTKLKTAENEYGVSLEGVTVLVDAGHGGRDNGASGYKNGVHEQHLNLKLALEVEKQLKALGATVIMTRTDDSYIEVDDRILAIKNNKPDYVISIHRNSSSNINASGFSSYYFNPYSYDAANTMLSEVNSSGAFKQTAWTFVRWHVFFLCRVTDCPTVLTENGFVSNKAEYSEMLTEEQTEKNAKALVSGIVTYFKGQ